jgi:NarL family two-component system response regulator LiaR
MQDRDGPKEEVDAREPLRVVIVDDDALTRRMVRDALQDAGVVVIAEAGGGREAIELCLYYKPDVVLMDIVMPDLDGLAATRHIVARLPETKVVMFTSAQGSGVGLTALRLGACGYVTKSEEHLARLPDALAAAYRGEAVVSGQLTMRLVETVRQIREDGLGIRPVRSTLTPREWEVLDLLCQGMSTDEVTDVLVLSPETVRSHVKSVLRKLGVRSRREAIEAAQRMRSGMLVAPTG